MKILQNYSKTETFCLRIMKHKFNIELKKTITSLNHFTGKNKYIKINAQSSELSAFNFRLLEYLNNKRWVKLKSSIHNKTLIKSLTPQSSKKELTKKKKKTSQMVIL